MVFAVMVRGLSHRSMVSMRYRIYVLLEDAVYYFEPVNHSLVFYKRGDYRSVSPYPSPVVLGLAWNDSVNSDGDV